MSVRLPPLTMTSLIAILRLILGNIFLISIDAVASVLPSCSCSKRRQFTWQRDCS